jgi:hypothetical protein
MTHFSTLFRVREEGLRDKFYETYVSQVERRNAEPMGGCVMLYVQNAHVDDIAVLMPSNCY